MTVKNLFCLAWIGFQCGGAFANGKFSAQSIGPDAATGSSAAVVVDENASLVHTAQFLPLDRKGEIIGKGDISVQARQVFLNLAGALKSAGSDLTQVVKINVCLARPDDLAGVQKVFSQFFGGEGKPKPAVSFVVGDLVSPDAWVAMDAVAISSDSGRERKPLQLFNSFASAAVLPAGPKIYVSGMADTNALPEATRKTLEKLLGVLNHFGLKKSDVVQLKVFMRPMSEVGTVRLEIAGFFNGQVPPVVFVDWISPPPNPPIEIELIAAATTRDRSPIAAATISDDAVSSQSAPDAGRAAGGDRPRSEDSVSFITPPGTTSSKVFSRVARVNHGRLIYTSGLYGMKSQDAAGQVREIFSTLGDLMRKAGSDFTHLVKATYYVSDNDASNKLNELRPEFFDPQRPPAASKAKVKGTGLPGKTVTLDMIAVTK